MKDASEKRLLVEAWGPHFAQQLAEAGVDTVVCLMNFSVRGDGTSVSLSGEYAAESERGSAFLLMPTSEDVLKRFETVEREGGDVISTPWQPAGPVQMSPEGPCYAACLASVRNSSLAFGTDLAQPVQQSSRGSVPDGSTSGSVPDGRGTDVWLPAEVRVFVPGVWLADVRDADVVYTPCSACKKKIPEGATTCAQLDCSGKASEEKTVFTAVTLSDSTGTLTHVLVRTKEMLAFTGFTSVPELEKSLQAEGQVSLLFRCRADVLLGAQRATRFGVVTVATWELLLVRPLLLGPWNTPSRPAAAYAFVGVEASGEFEKVPC